jgi:hypothetical protein
MRLILIALTLCCLAQTAGAQPATSIDTELVKGRCRFIDDDGEVGHYALKRCPGLAGSRVYTEAGVHSVLLSFRWGRRKAVDVVKSDSIGTKLEWRGTGPRAAFKPYAVIVTIVVKDYDADKNHNVLGVLRMEPRSACLMAVIDEDANKDARSSRARPPTRTRRRSPARAASRSSWARRPNGLTAPSVLMAIRRSSASPGHQRRLSCK